MDRFDRGSRHVLGGPQRAPIRRIPVVTAGRPLGLEGGDELERAKERSRKDAAREVEQRRRGILLDFIEVLDDLDRALEAARRTDRDPGLVEGVGLVRKRFLVKLDQHGVTRAPALGQRFDPARHEAVNVVPVSDPVQDGMVVGVTREGYWIGDEVLRPAAVAVGQVL